MSPVTVATGTTVEIDGVSGQSLDFAGATGTLKLDDAVAFTGQVSGLTGSDALDLADVSYGPNTKATFSGNPSGGTLTVSNGTETARIALVGDYLKSGWTLSNDGNGGTVVVDPPGFAFPDATNTGVSAGVTLKPSGSLTISAPGVYSGLDISGGVVIDASNVTLENCVINMGTSDNEAIAVAGGLKNVVIQNCEVAGSGPSGQSGDYGILIMDGTQVTINACNIHDVASGIVPEGGTVGSQVTIENSYIHNLNGGAGSHINGIGFFGQSGPNFSLLIQGNTVVNSNDQTDAIMLQNYFGSVKNVTVNNNLLIADNYTMYIAGNEGTAPVANVTATDNAMTFGQYGYFYIVPGSASQFQYTVSGNYDASTGAAAGPNGSQVSTPNLISELTSTTAPQTTELNSIIESPSSGDLNAGNTVTITLNMSEVVNVAGGTPTLTLNDGGVATYIGGSGSNALTFSYTVGAGQNTAALAATAVNLNSATVTDGAGNAASLSLSGLTQSGPQIDTTTPTITSLTESPASGDLNAGQTVTMTLKLSEQVTVADGTPTLTLNDGGVATYIGGSGSNALTFSYTVGAGQNTAALAATAVNLNSATVTDGAGNAASLSLSGLTQSGPQIDTTTPTITSLTESPASGDLNAGQTVTMTLKLSEQVTVADGTPTLTLNDGGVATYIGGSGSNALTFSYTVGAGQNTAALAATAVNLNSATVTDGADNAADLSLTGLTQSGPQIDTTTPSAPGSSGDNLVTNGSFGTDSFSGWTLGGNDTSTRWGPQIFIGTNAEGGSTYAAEMGSMGSDGSISQTIATTAGQEYQLTFWLANDLHGHGATPNDFTAKWNGTSLLSVTNAPQQGYTEYNYVVVATSSSTTLEFDARQDPSIWSLDNISVTPVGTGVTVGTGAALEISAADSASVTFNGSTGLLKLDTPSTFTGEIYNFTGNGTLSGSDQIDLKNINYNSVQDSYANGVLTVTDGNGDTDKLDFNGSYSLGNFDFASDGSGGTIVYDPPVTSSPGQKAAAPTTSASDAYLPNGNQTAGTLSLSDGIHGANIALLANYMASSFATACDNHRSTVVIAEPTQPNDQSVLSNPHHA